MFIYSVAGLSLILIVVTLLDKIRILDGELSYPLSILQFVLVLVLFPAYFMIMAAYVGMIVLPLIGYP